MSRRGRSRRSPWLVVTAALVLAGIAWVGLQPPPASGPSSGTATGITLPTAGETVQLLEQLPVKGRAPMTGYDRDQFGQAWADTNNNSCSTRDDILARDLTDIRVDADGCTVLSGVLPDPYTGTRIRFTRGPDSSRDVQVDHVVSLSDGWQKGAQQLTAEDRLQFANDPRNLLAVDGPTNMAKGDGDAATWLPPNRQFRCQYVTQQVVVKQAYRLWVTTAEREAMERILARCPG